MSQNCIALGDVDGDSCNELVVGVSGKKCLLLNLVYNAVCFSSSISLPNI